MRFLIAPFFLLLGFPSFGQLLRLEKEHVNEWTSVLDPTFISSNGIRAIEITQKSKRRDRPFESMVNQMNFGYDRQGRTISMLEIIPLFGQRDTIHTVIDHGDPSLTTRIKNGQCTRTIHRKKADGYIESKFSCRFEHSAGELLIRDSLLLETEEVKVSSLNELETIYRYYTGSNLPYKEIKVARNELGYVILEKTTFLITRQNVVRHMDYNRDGNLSVVRVDDEVKKNSSSWNFSYDEQGKLTDISTTVDGRLKKESSLVYDGVGLPLGMVETNVGSDEIIMYKFAYEFYE